MTGDRSAFEMETAAKFDMAAPDAEAAARPVVYAIFLLLGIGTLLPFNVFITERDFFEASWTAFPCPPRVTLRFWRPRRGWLGTGINVLG